MVAANDIIILNSVLEQKQKESEDSISQADYFEIFTFEQILKDYDLSYDELLMGRTSGGDDGGFDSIYLMINNELVTESVLSENYRKNPLIEIFLVQSKKESSFKEQALDKAISSIKELFDLKKDMKALRSFYNEDVVEKITLFREAYLTLASKHPNLRIKFFYACKGDTNDIHPKISNKSETLKSTILDSFSGSNVEVNFLGARELLDLSRIEKTYTLQLKFVETFFQREEDYVVLCSLPDYFSFVTDQNGNLRKYIFDANVRDFEGLIEVIRI